MYFRWLSDGFVNVKALQKPVSNFIKIFNMYGKVIGGSISVDCFHEVTENGIYFLTEGHLNEPLPSHVDHVYTSPYNARLLQIKFKVNPENIVSLPINEKLLIQDNIKKLNFNVTLIDAKQKPGAVMFLFEGDDIGSVIYAGNCCYGWTGFNRPFQSFLKAKKLDYLYVYPPCPDCELHTMSVSELVDNLVNIIRWNPNCKFLIHDPCCREDILTDLKNRVKKPICVSENLMKHLEEVGQGADFDLDHNKSQIIVTDKLDYKMTLNEQEPLFKIILIPCSMKRFSQEIQVKAKDYHLMLYRNHCSPSELVSLVRDIDARHTVLIRPSPATSNLRHRPKGLAFWSHLGDFHRVLQFFDSIVEETHHKAELQNAGESQLTDKEDYTIEADKTDVTNCSDRSKTPPSISIIMIDSDIELNEPSK